MQGALRPYLPSYASVQNPVDLTPIWAQFPRIYPPLMENLLASSEVDFLIVGILDVATAMEDLLHVLATKFTRTDEDVSSGKPIYFYWTSLFSNLKNMAILEQARLPCYQTSFEIVRVAAAISHYGMQSAEEPH